MKVIEAIHELDSRKPNSCPQEQKILWLDRLDSFIKNEILSRYPEIRMDLINPGDPDRELLMEEPFSEAYLYWLESRIHYSHEETEGYNAAIRMFRSLFEDYQRSLHQKNTPENPGIFRF